MLMLSSVVDHSFLLGASGFVSKTNDSYEGKYKRGSVLLEITTVLWVHLINLQRIGASPCISLSLT